MPKQKNKSTKFIIQGVSFNETEMDILAYAKAQAAKDGRPLSNWIRRLIEQHREQNPNQQNGNESAGQRHG